MTTVQIQDKTGNWITLQTITNNPTLVKLTMDALHRTLGKKMRALDKDGKIIDWR